MKNLIFILVLTLAVFAVSCQKPVLPPDSKPDAELTEGEAGLRIAKFEANVKALQARLDEINKKS